MSISVVIPAYNEATRVAHVVRAVAECDFITEIIVVDDGSEDHTAAVSARCERAHVVRLPVNRGKGAAVLAGSRLATGSICLLLDADLTGVTPDHLRDLTTPILAGEAEMTVGILSGGSFWSDAGQGVSPALSGQRALHRSSLVSIDGLGECRMGVEVLINQSIRADGGRIVRIPLEGVHHTLKEQKMGWRRGLRARGRMYREIGQTMLKLRRT
jgi:glycosyltransferase involved in cell wall biosynthesis